MNKDKLEHLDAIIKKIDNMKKHLEYLKDELGDLKDKEQGIFDVSSKKELFSKDDELEENTAELVRSIKAENNIKSLRLNDIIEVKVHNFFTGLTTSKDEIQSLEEIKQRLLNNISRIDRRIERLKNQNVMEDAKIEIRIFDSLVGVMAKEEAIQFVEEIKQQFLEDISNINTGIERIKNLDAMKGSEDERI